MLDHLHPTQRGVSHAADRHPPHQEPGRVGRCDPRLPRLLYQVPIPSLDARETPPWTPLNRGSDNIEVLGHLPLGPDENLVSMCSMKRGGAQRMLEGPIGKAVGG
jgi:hypothetical protein